MRKPDFNKATVLATNLLSMQNLSERFLDVKSMNFDRKIIFVTYEEYAQLTRQPLPEYDKENKNSPGNTGLNIKYTVGNKTIYLVAYNDRETNYERRNWTLAHEVGHIYLGHEIGKGVEEIEAHYFASQLFMPEYTLHMMEKNYGKFDAEDLAEIFGVSYSAAKKRLNSFKRMRLINASPADKAIWARQKEKIDLYFYCTRKLGGDFRGTLEMMNIYNEEMESLMYY